MMYTFCRSELMYTKCIPNFAAIVILILYTKCIQKFVEMWDTFCIHFVYKMYTQFLCGRSKHCVLDSAGYKNDGADSNNIIFTINDTKQYVPVITLSTKDNQKLSKLLIKESEGSVYWIEYKTKSEYKNMTNE